jgi:hypothetical protein
MMERAIWCRLRMGFQAMRPQSVRFTVRRLMIAVAVTVTVLPLAAGTVWVLSPEQVRLRALISAYEAKAAHHAELQHAYARMSEFSASSHGIAIREGQLIHIPNGQDAALVPNYVELARYHRALRDKYESAAWRPRLPVEPDPPEPPLPRNR